jgi:hypothetical protein
LANPHQQNPTHNFAPRNLRFLLPLLQRSCGGGVGRGHAQQKTTTARQFQRLSLTLNFSWGNNPARKKENCFNSISHRVYSVFHPWLKTPLPVPVRKDLCASAPLRLCVKSASSTVHPIP